MYKAKYESWLISVKSRHIPQVLWFFLDALVARLNRMSPLNSWQWWKLKYYIRCTNSPCKWNFLEFFMNFIHVWKYSDFIFESREYLLNLWVNLKFWAISEIQKSNLCSFFQKTLDYKSVQASIVKKIGTFHILFKVGCSLYWLTYLSMNIKACLNS